MGPRSPLSRRTQLAFLLLVLAQSAHSVEEYFTGLYDVFAPARLISGLVCDERALGFLVVNAALVAFGAWCWAVPVRSGWSSARVLAWGWVLVELGNGIGHSALAVASGGYFPGALTAPLLFAIAVWLALLLRRRSGRSEREVG
jgi:hypothetical protein